MTPTPFDAEPNDSMPPMSRRQFATLVAATTLSACGGGGGGGSSAPPAPAPAPNPSSPLPPAPAPVIPPPPPPAAPAKPNTLSFVAGGLGGSGFAPAARLSARFPYLEGMAAKPDGTLLVNFDLTSGSLAEVPTKGMVLLDPAQPDQPARSLPYYYRPRLIGVSNREMGLDGNGRFVFSTAVSQQIPDGVLIWRLDNVTATFVAGGASATTLTLDGSGANARVCSFGSPCTVSTGLTYFLDAVDLYGKTALRTLDGQGMVKTVISDSPPGTLVIRSNGGLLLFSYFRNGAAELTSTGQWYELMVAPDGTHSWRTLSTNWPTGANLLIPLGLVGGTTDTFWCRGFLGNTVTYRQCRLDGTLLSPAVTVNASADAISSGNLITAQEGCSVVVFGPTGVELARYGTSEARGQMDGQGSQARLDLRKSTSIYQPGPEAYTDPNGDLYITNNGSQQPSYPINDGSTYSTPMRRITPQGQVTSLALKSSGLGLTRHADGDWLTAGDANFPRPSSNTAWLGTGIFKAPGDGSGQWKLWAAAATTGAPVKADLAYTRALRTDSTGNLYFAEGSTSRSRYLCFLPCATPTQGGNMVGLVSPGGQVQAAAGTFDGRFTANDSYPIESQRPWYYDIVDFALETDQVAWVLCSRPAGTGETPASPIPYKPVLYRVTAGVPDKRIELPSAWTGGSNDVYTRICVLRNRPGEVFLAGYSAVYRWSEAQGLTVLAGNPTLLTGVQLGALPAGLGEVTFLAPGPVPNSLYVGSENSVLQITLP